MSPCVITMTKWLKCSDFISVSNFLGNEATYHHKIIHLYSTFHTVLYIYTCITIHAFHNCPHHNIDNNKTIIPNLTSTNSTHQYLIMETVFLTVTCTVVTCENSIEISFFYSDKHTIIFPKGWSEANFNTNTVFPGIEMHLIKIGWPWHHPHIIMI